MIIGVSQPPETTRHCLQKKAGRVTACTVQLMPCTGIRRPSKNTVATTITVVLMPSTLAPTSICVVRQPAYSQERNVSHHPPPPPPPPPCLCLSARDAYQRDDPCHDGEDSEGRLDGVLDLAEVLPHLVDGSDAEELRGTQTHARGQSLPLYT